MFWASLWAIKTMFISVAIKPGTMEKNSVANCVVIKFFLCCPTFVGLGPPIDGGLISTIDLATKFGLPSNKM